MAKKDSVRIRVFNPKTNKVKYVTPAVANSMALKIQGFIKQDLPKPKPIVEPSVVTESDDELLPLEDEDTTGLTTANAQKEEPKKQYTARELVRMVGKMTSKKQLKDLREEEMARPSVRKSVVKAINDKLKSL